jgi:hypothetical protein
MRKLFILILATISTSVFAHEIEGVVTHQGTKLPEMKRTQIPFDSSIKETSGRTYILWIAPDGAIAFCVDPKLMEKEQAPLTHIWMIHAKEQLKIPEGFDSKEPKDKSDIEGVESMKGPFRIDWGNDLDYTIFLDVKGTDGKHSFKGYLYGSPQNKKI